MIFHKKETEKNELVARPATAGSRLLLFCIWSWTSLTTGLIALTGGEGGVCFDTSLALGKLWICSCTSLTTGLTWRGCWQIGMIKKFNFSGYCDLFIQY